MVIMKRVNFDIFEFSEQYHEGMHYEKDSTSSIFKVYI